MGKQPNEYMQEILHGGELSHRIAYVLWDGGQTAQGALWHAERILQMLEHSCVLLPRYTPDKQAFDE